MKATVGVMLTSFGVFFVGEGIGVDWWHADASLVLLVAIFGTLFVVCSRLLVHPPGRVPVPRLVRAVAVEIWGLLVGAGSLALAAVASVLAAALLAARVDDAAGWAGVVLVGGVVLALVVTVAGSRRPTD